MAKEVKQTIGALLDSEIGGMVKEIERHESIEIKQGEQMEKLRAEMRDNEAKLNHLKMEVRQITQRIFAENGLLNPKPEPTPPAATAKKEKAAGGTRVRRSAEELAETEKKMRERILHVLPKKAETAWPMSTIASAAGFDKKDQQFTALVKEIAEKVGKAPHVSYWLKG